MIAVTMPGKIGDALFTLPVIRALCERHQTTADFITSSYCSPITRLFQYQRCINRVVIPENYKIERMDMGCQPWDMPVEEGYDAVYHLGFRGIPDTRLDLFMARYADVAEVPDIYYEFPMINTIEAPYYVVAPRGESSYKKLFLDVIERSPNPVYVIGGHGEYIGKGVDLTGLDMLDTVAVLAKADGFIGLMSSQLVLANGFDIPKVIPHDGRSWDMRHVVYSSKHFYEVNPSVDRVLGCLLERKIE